MYLRLKVIGKKNKNAKNKKMEKTLKENERFHLLIDDPILKNHITRQLAKGPMNVMGKVSRRKKRD